MLLIVRCSKGNKLPPPQSESISGHYLITTSLGCREPAIGKPWENTDVDVRISIWQTDLDGEGIQILKDTFVTRRRISDFPILPGAYLLR